MRIRSLLESTYTNNEALNENVVKKAFTQISSIPDIDVENVKHYFKKNNSNNWVSSNGVVDFNHMMDLITKNNEYFKDQNIRHFLIHCVETKETVLLRLIVLGDPDRHLECTGFIINFKDYNMGKYIPIRFRNDDYNELSRRILWLLNAKTSSSFKLWGSNDNTRWSSPDTGPLGQARKQCNQFIEKMHDHLWVAIRRKLNKMYPYTVKKFVDEVPRSFERLEDVSNNSVKVWYIVKQKILDQIRDGSLKFETPADRVSVLNRFVVLYINWFMDKFSKSQ